MMQAEPVLAPPATVQQHMTLAPTVVSSSLSLADAAKIMRAGAFRHLPVVDDGQLVGVISERDINVARCLRSKSLSEAKVGLLMQEHPLEVSPEARLSDVAARMVDRKVGSAIVVHEGRVVGIFTVHDALLALHAMLAARW
jgi:acetoin utilization protein AcuB